MPQLVRAFDAKVDVDEADRTVVSTINTDAVDRYKTVILPTGGVFDGYRKNAVVLLNHGGGPYTAGADALPVGRNLWIKAQKGRLLAKTQFLPAGTCELADKVWELYRLEYLNAWSIRFDPIEYGRPTPAELRARPDWAGAEVIYRKWELVEYSCVTVPGNAECARAATARGLALPGWPAAESAPPAATPPALPPPRGRTPEQVRDAIRRQVRAEFSPATRAALAKDVEELARGMV